MRPFRYEAGNGFLHRLHPLAKLAALASLATASFLGHPLALPPASVAVAAGLVSLRLRLADLRPAALFLGWMALAALLMRLVSFESGKLSFVVDELGSVLMYLSRLALLWAAADILFRSTSPSRMGEALSSLQRKLGLGRRVDLGLFIGLCLDFIPRAFAAWDEAMDAAHARGWSRRSRPSAAVDVLAAFLQRSMRSAIRSSEALEARCFAPGRSLDPGPFRAADAVFVASALLFLLASLAAGRLA